MQVKKEKIRSRTVTGTAGTESAFCELKKYFCSRIMTALLERRSHFANKKRENPLQNRDGHSWNGERILRIPKELKIPLQNQMASQLTGRLERRAHFANSRRAKFPLQNKMTSQLTGRMERRANCKRAKIPLQNQVTNQIDGTAGTESAHVPVVCGARDLEGVD